MFILTLLREFNLFLPILLLFRAISRFFVYLFISLTESTNLVLSLCSICLCDVTEDDELYPPYLLPCGHWFHRLCLSNWLMQHNNCPNCRRYITQLDNGRTLLSYRNQLDYDDEYEESSLISEDETEDESPWPYPRPPLGTHLVRVQNQNLVNI